MQTEQIFLVNYLDLVNKLFKVYINFYPLSKETPANESSPKIDLMLRILDTRGSPLLPPCSGSASIWVFPIDRSQKSTPYWRMSSAKGQKQRKDQGFCRLRKLRTCSGIAIELEKFSCLSHHFSNSEARNYIQLVKKETELFSRLVCLYY